MNFGNNIERMAFEKGEWPFVEIPYTWVDRHIAVQILMNLAG